MPLKPSKGQSLNPLTGQREYIDSVVESASVSPWRDQIYVTYDMFDDTMEVIDV